MIKKRSFLSFKVVVALLLVGSFSLRLYADEFRIEGIMYDQANPAESIAIIDGESVHAGQNFRGYLIKAIGPTSVEMIHLESEEKTRANVTEAPKKVVESLSDSIEESESEFEENLPKESFIEQLKKAPGRILNYGLEMKAIYDLAIMNNACVNYYNLMGFFPGHLKQLTNADLIKDTYAEGRSGKYRFYFDSISSPHGFGLHADPLDEGKGLHYFFASEDAVIRSSLRKPANRDSKPHKYPGMQK